MQEYPPVEALKINKRLRIKRILLGCGIAAAVFLFVVAPVALSFLITNSRFRFPERGPRNPEALGLSVEEVTFRSDDRITLRGWWNAGDAAKPVIAFVHGLNRSRLEHLEKAVEAHKRGYGVLLFDLRNHGASDRAYTTLGVKESHDVCAAREFLNLRASGRPQILWGVSLGASTSLLAERRCPGSAAIISDSSFLSFSETIRHHFRLIFRIPAFPIADIIIRLTCWRMGFSEDDGDVEAAVAALHDVQILFIAGSADVRMPPDLARRLAARAENPEKQILIVEGASHGQAFVHNRELYLKTVWEFLEK